MAYFFFSSHVIYFASGFFLTYGCWTKLKAIASWSLINALLCQSSDEEKEKTVYQVINLSIWIILIKICISETRVIFKTLFNTTVSWQLKWKSFISSYMVAWRPINWISIILKYYTYIHSCLSLSLSTHYSC